MKIIKKCTDRFKEIHEKEIEYLFINDLVKDVVKYLNDDITRFLMIQGIKYVVDSDRIDLPDILDNDSYVVGFGTVWKLLNEKGISNEEIWKFISPCYSSYINAPVCFMFDKEEIDRILYGY